LTVDGPVGHVLPLIPMKKLLGLFFAAALASSASAAPDASTAPAAPTAPAASEASIERLLTVTHIDSLIDRTLKQVQTMTSSMAHQIAVGQHMSADDEAALDAETQKQVAAFKQFFSWDRMKRIYIQAYEQTFTQDEVDAMNVFYTTPAGQSVISKMPLVMQKTMGIMQPEMVKYVQQLQNNLQQFAAGLMAKHSEKQG
jgi:hypothetical protein